MQRRSLGAIAAVAVLVAGLAACSSGGTPSGGSTPSAGGSKWDSVVAAANKEGSVTVYTVIGDENQRNELVAAFNKEYPSIQVNLIRLDSGPLTARVASEMQAGSQTADVMELVDNIIYTQHPEYFRSMTTATVPNLAKWPAKYVGPDDKYIHNLANEFIVEYNKTLVKDVPKTWKGLADWSQLKKAQLADPNSSGSFMGWSMFIDDKLGDDVLAKYGKGVGGVFQSSATAAQQVAAGEIPVGIPSVKDLTSAAVRQGAPVVRQSMTPTIGTSHMWALPKSKGGHPNAGLVWMNFIMSKSAAKITCNGGDDFPIAYSDIKGCPQVPKDLTLIADYFPKLDDTVRAHINDVLGLDK